MIFVFGSNLAGRHGKGAALFARDYHGAIYGNGQGRQNDSYAIPTKGHRLEVLSLDEIRFYVNRFIQYARYRPYLDFFVTRIGCGYAGYRDVDIAPLFEYAPSNCHLPEGWREYIRDEVS